MVHKKVHKAPWIVRDAAGKTLVIEYLRWMDKAAVFVVKLRRKCGATEVLGRRIGIAKSEQTPALDSRCTIEMEQVLKTVSYRRYLRQIAQCAPRRPKERVFIVLPILQREAQTSFAALKLIKEFIHFVIPLALERLSAFMPTYPPREVQ